MKKKLGVALFLLGLLLSRVSISGEFSKPTNTVGDANCFGDLQFTSHLGVIQLSRNEVYDFYYQYSSFSEYDSPHFGKGFFVPLLEATLIDYDYFLEITTMGGATIYVYQLPADPNTYSSLNGKNTVSKHGDDKFSRRNDEGFTFEYWSGKLVGLESPEKTRLVFEYEGNFCKTVRSSTGATVCSVNKTSPSHSLLSTAGGRFELDFQQHPESGSDLPLPTLATVKWPDQKTTRFEYPEKAENSGNTVMRMTYDDQIMECIWSRESGQLLESDGVKYDISPLNRDFDPDAERTRTGAYTINRTFPDGSWKTFSHDEDAGFADYEDSFGAHVRTHFINTRGKVFNFVSKRERLGNNGEKPEVFYEAFYDTEGQLIREVTEGTVTWYLRDGGLPETVVKENDNFVKFDSKNRVKFSRFGEITYETQWMADESKRVLSKYPWGEVMVRYFSPNGSPRAMPSTEKFKERDSI